MVAKQFIHVLHKKHGDYASIYSPKRINGKKVNDPVYLGRVIDLEQGLFKSREKGLFKFSFENGYTIIEPSESTKIAREEYILALGHVYTAYEILKNKNYIDLFTKIDPNNSDTLLSLIFFRLLTDVPYNNAYSWWNSTYCRLLFPKASMQSQRISEYLTFLGKEVNLELFFKNYIHLIYGPNTGCGIVIDSTGATNLNIDLTKLNNHNGSINNEIRLIYVIDREKKVPIYYRVVADNIIDVTTLQNTINELKALNIDVKYSVLDAGYYSEDNINFLYSNNINFLTRMVPSHVIAKDLISKHFDEVNHAKNLVRHNNRFLFVKKIPFKLFDYKAFAYISIDSARQFNECETLFKNTYGTKNFNPDQIELERKTLATFILLSSIDLDIFEVIPYYSSRNYIEQIFDVAKIDTLLLSLRVHSIEALMGHILINFLTEISYLAINQEFINTTYGAKNALYELSCLYSKVLNNQIHTYEPNEKMKELLKILKIDIPKVLYLPT